MIDPKLVQNYCLGSCIVGGLDFDRPANNHCCNFLKGQACSCFNSDGYDVELSFSDAHRCQAVVLERYPCS